MTRNAHHDFETRSACDLRKSGAYRYFEHPTTEVLCMAWGMGDGLVYPWLPGDEPPSALLQHVENGGTVGAHGASFERLAWRWMRERGGHSQWPALPIKQQDCTMSRAAALGFPQDLDTLSVVLKSPEPKDNIGFNLMKKLTSPRKIVNGKPEWWPESAVPGGMDYVCRTYCPQDVRAEEWLDAHLLPLSAHERLVWELDQKVNDRGVYVDETAVTRAVDVVLVAKRRADIKMRELTDGYVEKCTQVDRILEWIQAEGIAIDSAKKGNHDEIIGLAEVSDKPHVVEVIRLRKEASKTSTAKYAKMLECICADGRIRGLLNYHGARTGRWAGRLVQPQNFPRVDPDNDGPMVEYVAELLAADLSLDDIHDMIEMAGYEVLPSLSKSLRGMICAA